MSAERLKLFFDRGALCTLSARELAERCQSIKLLLFDWDGVFNTGHKEGGTSSSFSEVDSMGVNLLRFGLYLQNGNLPKSFILSGASNSIAKSFAEREHFDGVYLNFKNKQLVLDRLLSQHALAPENVAFFYDDVLDLQLAASVGLNIFLGGERSPALLRFLKERSILQLQTANEGGMSGLREACDMLLTAMGKYESAVDERMTFSEKYAHYWDQRQSLSTHFEKAQ